jgi:hypothetical protein
MSELWLAGLAYYAGAISAALPRAEQSISFTAHTMSHRAAAGAANRPGGGPRRESLT